VYEDRDDQDAKLLPLLHGSPFAIRCRLAALALLLISESSFQQASSRVEALAYQARHAPSSRHCGAA